MDVISLLTLLLNDGSQRVAGRLPAKVDLRPLMSPVETKGETQSSVANAAAGANEYLQKRHLGEAGYDVSRLFVYFNARNREVEGDGAITDSGSCIQDAIADCLQAQRRPACGACCGEQGRRAPDTVEELIVCSLEHKRSIALEDDEASCDPAKHLLTVSYDYNSTFKGLKRIR